jgi:hypothetical protein
LRKVIAHITRYKKTIALTAMVLLCVLPGTQSLHAQTNASKEYKLKAVFLFNFTQFIEWPSSAFASAGSPFIIGILGDDPFGFSIEETVQNERVGGHPLVVQRYHDIRDMRPCHILFINSKDPEKIKESLLVAGRNTLTVSDADGFVKMGGMIRFITENNKIKLQIYPDMAKAAELLISSKLLRVSDIYDPKLQPR